MSFSILCPVDFSDASAEALRYGAAIAERLSAQLIVMTVEDPLLTEAMDLGTGVVWDPDMCRTELARFAGRTLARRPARRPPCVYEVAVGKPAPEILRVADARHVDLIVMSTHGLTGMRKLFFGSTTERVLRETTRPVLVCPPHRAGATELGASEWRLARVLLPVDLSSLPQPHVGLARRIGNDVGVPLLVAHVLEPSRSVLRARRRTLAGIDATRAGLAEEHLARLVEFLPEGPACETLVAYGEPAEELAKIAMDRRADLIVIGLHGSPATGPRMGSVTYRLLCLAPVLTLAVPPAFDDGKWTSDDAGGRGRRAEVTCSPEDLLADQ